MQLTSTLYRNSIFVFAVFFTLVTWGFWSTYYSNPLEMVALGNSLTAVHLHGAGMTLWCVMLVSQAYLIRTNRRDLHRMIGRSSYVLAPVVIVLQWLVVRNVVLADPMMLGEQGTLTNFAAVFMSLVLGGSVLVYGPLRIGHLLPAKYGDSCASHGSDDDSDSSASHGPDRSHLFSRHSRLSPRRPQE